jgi:hypothetical protein
VTSPDVLHFGTTGTELGEFDGPEGIAACWNSATGAYDISGFTDVLFTSSFDNTAGTFHVNSSGLGTPFGLTGNGPLGIADVRLRAEADAIDLASPLPGATFTTDLRVEGAPGLTGV